MQEPELKSEIDKFATRHHTIAAWAAVLLNPVWSISDYFICPDYWKVFLIFRITITFITYAGIILHRRRFINNVTLVFIPFVGIALQNAYMYSVMDVDAVQNHTFAYIALFIGAGMFLVWKPINSIVVISVTALVNITLFNYLSPITASQILMNGGLLTITVCVFTIMLTHARYISIQRQIRSKLQLKETNRQISEQKNTIEKNAMELQEINSKLSRFAYVISHDLKAPVRGIKHLATWITEDKENVLSPETREYLHLMHAQTGNMDRLINGILNYSKAGNNSLEIEEINLNELIIEITGVYSSQQSIKLEVASKLPVIYYNRAAATQIFQNLLSNSIKHNDKELKEIKVFCLESDNHFEFAISDNGPGIPIHHHERVFELFQTLTDKKENTGIGLPVVKKLVEDAGGKIWIESSAGQGASFRISLPKSLFTKELSGNSSKSELISSM